MQQVVIGLSSGAVYALFALGFTLVFSVLDRLNLAHAAVFAIGAFTGIELVERAGLPIAAAIPVVFVIGGVFGVAVERVAFAPLKNRPDAHFGGMIASIAVGAMLISVLQARYGTETNRFPAGTFPYRRFEVGGVWFTLLDVVIVSVSLGLTVLLWLLVERTGVGRAMRAVAENPHAARLVGINVDGVTAFSFALSSGLGATAGVLQALTTNTAGLNMGYAVELKGLAVIIVGGMGSIPGALVGGLVLGLAEALTIAHIGSKWRDVAAFGMLVAILLLRPQGLFGRAQVRQV